MEKLSAGSFPNLSTWMSKLFNQCFGVGRKEHLRWKEVPFFFSFTWILFQFHHLFSFAHGFALESGTGIAKVLRTRADISHHVQSRRIVLTHLSNCTFHLDRNLAQYIFAPLKKKSL